MRYLTLSADYMNASLRDHSDGPILIERAGLVDDLVARIIAWNADYQVIVTLDADERRSLAGQIDELDKRGLALASEIEIALAPSKVRYYSEGGLRSL